MTKLGLKKLYTSVLKGSQVRDFTKTARPCSYYCNTVRGFINKISKKIFKKKIFTTGLLAYFTT
jgi:hypothetical protein